jgi:Leucine-rich repeat (LRR) protein
MTAPKPKLRWFQYSLRTLLVFVTLCAIPCSWLAVKMRQAKRQRSVVQAVLAAGGIVMRRADDDATDFIDLDKMPSPPTLAESLFRRQRVVLVSLADETCTYDVADPPITISSFRLGRDASRLNLATLGELPDLEFVDLGDRQVNDRDCLNLAACSRLQVLVARHCSDVTDHGIQSLTHLRCLRVLRLDGCKLGRTGAQCVGGLRELQRLELDNTTITDDDLEYLKGLADLRVLSLRKTNITDRGARHLLPLTRLRQLNLADTSVTDAALVYLKNLSELETLNLGGTHVTFQGANAFEDTRSRSIIIR